MEKVLAPTLGNDRIEIIDVVRGFAVFGILLSNILIMSGFYFTPFSTFKDFHLSGLNDILYTISRHIIVGKSYPLFSMLFGVGFYIQFQKFNKGEHSFARFFSWRMTILLMIGLIHLVVWPGDVVNNYALLGFFLIPFRNVKPNTLLILSIFFILLFAGMENLDRHMHRNDPKPTTERITILQFPNTDAHELIDKVQNDGIEGMAYFNKKQYNILYNIRRLKAAYPQLLGLFFLGAFLFAKGLITRKMYNWKYLLAFALLGGLGKYLMTVNFSFRLFENIFMALFFLTLWGMIFKTNFGKKSMSFLIPVGKMPLTNYMMQSLLAIPIFYGIGLGLFTKVPYYGIYLIAFGILAIQSIYSHYWLKRFKYGPMEWLWRTLSYNKNLSLSNKK